MRVIGRPVCSSLELLFLALVASGCSDTAAPTVGSSAGGSGGVAAPASGGSTVVGGSGGSAPVVPDPGSGGTEAQGGSAGSVVQAGTGGSGGAATEGGSGGVGVIPDWCAEREQPPMGTEGDGPQPDYEGNLPIYCGAEVGPIVEMDCPGDPTEGWTDYAEEFRVQRPYTEPLNTRFSLINGVYTHWVFPDDSPHSATANGRNPRSEARYGYLFDQDTGNNFRTGERMFSADMFIEENAVGSAIMQIHTTADGGGPIGVRIMGNGNMVNNGSRTVVEGDNVPGGLIDTWFNYKASLNADTREVNIYINNCLQDTYTGNDGNGNFYFKNGVYFCKTSQNGCFTHFKNIRLYSK